MKTIIIGKVYDPILDCGHAGMYIETCYRDASNVGDDGNLQDEILEYEGKKVLITIEDME